MPNPSIERAPRGGVVLSLLLLWLVLYFGMRAFLEANALAVAFPLGLLLLTTLGLVQRAVTLKFEDWSYNHVVPYFAMFYIAGVVVARRRYT